MTRSAHDVASRVAKLLDRELDAEALREATELTARKSTQAQLATRSVFVFRLGAEWLALPSSFIDEVFELRLVHGLPHRRSGVVRGVAGVRGQLRIVISLQHLLHADSTVGHGPSRGNAVARLVVLVWQGQRLAFEADEVQGNHRFNPSELCAAPATVSQAAASFTTQVLPWRSHMIGLLDAELVLKALGRHLG